MRSTRSGYGVSTRPDRKVRGRVWTLVGQIPPARAAGRDIGRDVVVLDVDSTIVIAHSDKEGAAPTYKQRRTPPDPGDL